MSTPDEVFHVTATAMAPSNRTVGRWEMSLAASEHEARIRQHKLIHGPRLQCSRLEFDSAVTLTSSVPHGFVSFAISQASVGRPIVNNHELRPNEIIVLYSDEPVQYTCEPNETLFTLTTTVEHYVQCLENHSTIDVLAHRKEHRFQVAHFKLMQSAVEAISAHFTEAKEPPLQQRSGAEVAAIESALLISLLRALAPVGRSALRSPTRRKVAMQAIEYIHANTRKALCMKALVKQLETSTRTLHHGFVETFGISPIAYIRNLRLASVRRDLIRKTWPTVTETAMHWNFQHLSRFSRAYQDAYGEIPSETARRNSPKLATPHR